MIFPSVSRSARGDRMRARTCLHSYIASTVSILRVLRGRVIKAHVLLAYVGPRGACIRIPPVTALHFTLLTTSRDRS
jgi:hypothetical protein